MSNTIFRLLLAAFLEIFICILINFKAEARDNESDFESISRIVAVFMLVICSLSLLLLFFVTAMESNPELDPSEPHIASIETLYLDMHVKRKSASNAYVLSYMLRRAVYALVVILMEDYPALQIIILFLSSVLQTAILVRGRPYISLLSHWTMVGFELLFAWTCILCIMFSPEYMYRSFEIATDMANAICIITTCVAGIGLILLTYSLMWQAGFNKRRRENMEQAAELARLAKLRKNVQPEPLVPIKEESEVEDDYIPDGHTKRQRQKMRKIKDIRRLKNEATVADKSKLNEDDDFMLEDDYEMERTNVLEQMVALASQGPEAADAEDKLVISDDDGELKEGD